MTLERPSEYETSVSSGRLGRSDKLHLPMRLEAVELVRSTDKPMPIWGMCGRERDRHRPPLPVTFPYCPPARGGISLVRSTIRVPAA
jgi:hypothetical protein